MISKLCSHFQKSIFLKLSLSFICLSILITILVQAFITSVLDVNYSQKVSQGKNRAQYTMYLAEQIGNPPNLETARKLAHDLGIQIRIEGPGLSFSTSNLIPAYNDLKVKASRCPWQSNFLSGAISNKPFTLLETALYQYGFFFECDGFSENRLKFLPVLIASIFLILVGYYFWIRKLLKPIKWLNTGVAAVSTGDFDYQIPVLASTDSEDELARLSQSFNQMATKLKDMISAKQQLLLDVSHELRSPLTRIKVALELDGETYKAKIKKNLIELEGMIEELLETARLNDSAGSLKLSRLDLNPLIQKAVARYSDQPVQIELLQSPLESVWIEADSARIETVLRNLIDNAIKYSSEGPKIRIWIEQADAVSVHIQDFGQGIPEEELKNVFEPFYRVDKSRVRETGGYGLGLSLCRKIMNAHKGSITLNSGLGQGTQAVLRFPGTR